MVVLEAVQAECMNIEFLKNEFGKDIAFSGRSPPQSVLARTTPQQVTEGVRHTLRVMSTGGGSSRLPAIP